MMYIKTIQNSKFRRMVYTTDQAADNGNSKPTQSYIYDPGIGHRCQMWKAL